MVASDKRFLAKPEFRIQLGDLIGEEARKLERTLNGPDFALIGAFSNDLIMQRVARAESAMESVARIVGVLGRWGTGSELRLVLDLRIEFGVRESMGGLVTLINLRTYPAVLLLYAYGLALLAARRYTDLLKFLSVTIVTERDNTTTVVSHLFLTSCAGGENNAWKFLPGLEKRKTPLSDHLHDVFQSWTGDYLFSSNGYTTLFEDCELLCSLAYISIGTSKEDLQQATSGATGRSFAWCPMGRVSWDGQTRRRIMEGWARPEAADELTKADFARGQPEYLKLAMSRLNNLAGASNGSVRTSSAFFRRGSLTMAVVPTSDWNLTNLNDTDRRIRLLEEVPADDLISGLTTAAKKAAGQAKQTLSGSEPPTQKLCLSFGRLIAVCCQALHF